MCSSSRENENEKGIVLSTLDLIINRIALQIHKTADNKFSGTFHDVLKGVHHMVYHIWWSIIVNNPKECIGYKTSETKKKILKRTVEILRDEIKRYVHLNGKEKVADFFARYRVPNSIDTSKGSAFVSYCKRVSSK